MRAIRYAYWRPGAGSAIERYAYGSAIERYAYFTHLSLSRCF
jgi:hypothetical protein